MNPETRSRIRTSAAQPGSIRLGERLRQLRVSAGLTQTDLAGERFSKEYVSQIERGKTRPTDESVAWLASRLGVDAGFLANGVSTDERGRVESALARAEALLESDSVAEAAEEIAKLRTAVLATGVRELEARVLLNDAKVKSRLGSVREALELLAQVRAIVEGPPFSDVERAEVLFMFGVCRFKLSSIQTSIGLLSEALVLAERSGLPCDRLRSDILNWRSRGYRHMRDFEAAREDAERAIELADALGDRRALANANFQASIVAERQGHWVLARTYAERARSQYEELSSLESVGRMLNNLGGLNLLLGKPEDAEVLLKDSFRVALEVGNDADAARAISSLAQVHLRMGDQALAEEQARHALQLLGGREDYLDEIGNAQLTLGRALLEVGRLDEADAAFHDAASSFEQLSSASHKAAAWVAQGDLAAARGDDRAAARLYRSAAEALQDFRF